MNIFKSFFSDSKSVNIKQFMDKHRGLLFITITMSSILIISSVFCNVDIKYVLSLIFLVNQGYFRDKGWHSDSLFSCLIISTTLFSLFAYLSSIFMISPVLTIMIFMLLDYKNIDQHTSWILVFMLGTSSPEFHWIYSSCFFSIILSYLISGKNSSVTNIIIGIDNLIRRLFKQ